MQRLQQIAAKENKAAIFPAAPIIVQGVFALVWTAQGHAGSTDHQHALLLG